jgi:hypothetical protein
MTSLVFPFRVGDQVYYLVSSFGGGQIETPEAFIDSLRDSNFLVINDHGEWPYPDLDPNRTLMVVDGGLRDT